MTEAAQERPTAASARMAQDAADLTREQLRDLGRELAEPIRRAGFGAVLFAGAGVCGALAVVAAHQAALRVAESVLPRPLAAGALAAGYGAGAFALANAARSAMGNAADASDEVVHPAPGE